MHYRLVEHIEGTTKLLRVISQVPAKKFLKFFPDLEKWCL